MLSLVLFPMVRAVVVVHQVHPCEGPEWNQSGIWLVRRMFAARAVNPALKMTGCLARGVLRHSGAGFLRLFSIPAAGSWLTPGWQRQIAAAKSGEFMVLRPVEKIVVRCNAP